MPLAIEAFFHEPTNSVSYLVGDRGSGRAAVIDPVLDFDAKSGRTGTAFADRMIGQAESRQWRIEWVLETHPHADHVSAAAYVKARTGALVGIGAGVRAVQAHFAAVYDAPEIESGQCFDRLFDDGDRFHVGGLEMAVIAVPGHTPACIAYAVGDALFTGDTLFMPDYGTARADFPGADPAVLYRSIRRLLDRPAATRLFLCHDYKAPGRDSFCWETTVGAQRARNVHIHDGIDEASFVAMRRSRDQTLSLPALILPALQVNLRAGRFPDPAANGAVYLKLPVDRF
jgi:glyoxylase-like metal-dependent hydrolase (beta-lactamase superfamily II)